MTLMLGQLRPAHAVLLLVAVARPAFAQPVVISDGSFTTANWSQVIDASSVPGSIANRSQVLSGGNPGSFLSIDYSVPGPGNLNFITFYSAENYSPTVQGAIQSVSFSASLRNLSEANTAVFFGALQNGLMFYHRPPPFFFTDPEWTDVTLSSLSASSFAEPNTGVEPDFITGGPIQFGVMVSVGGGIFPSTFGLDNFHAEIVPVPEPSTIGLASVGAIALAFYARRKTSDRRAA